MSASMIRQLGLISCIIYAPLHNTDFRYEDAWKDLTGTLTNYMQRLKSQITLAWLESSPSCSDNGAAISNHCDPSYLLTNLDVAK